MRLLGNALAVISTGRVRSRALARSTLTVNGTSSRCGGRMIIVEAFEPGCQPRFWPVPSIGLDSS